jgi:hypothetical protein
LQLRHAFDRSDARHRHDPRDHRFVTAERAQ